MSNYNTIVKRMMVMIAIVGFVHSAQAQPLVYLPPSAGCVGHDLIIPIKVDEFNDIEAFSMRLSGDTSKIEFLGITNKNAALENGVFLDNILQDSDSKLAVSWVGHQSIHLNNDTLFSVKLLIKDSIADLVFEDQELILSDYTVSEDATFQKGRIISWNNLNPEVSDNNPEIGESVNISLPLLNGLNYQWQIQDDEEWIDLQQNQWYDSTQSNQLNIKEVKEDLNYKNIRCLLSVGECSEVSQDVSLNVQTVGWIDRETNLTATSVDFYPNPVNQYLICHFHNEFQNVSLELVDTHGCIVKELVFGYKQVNETIELSVKELSQGLYVLRLYEHETYIASHKFVKSK